MATAVEKTPGAMLADMSKAERSLLLYLEARAVDHGGTVCADNMNPADFTTAEHWAYSGFIRFSRVLSVYRDDNPHRPGPANHVVELNDEAWACAALERKRRAARSQRDSVQPSLRHFESLKKGSK